MSSEINNFAKGRRHVVLAAMQLNEGIALLRRRLERACGIDPNPSDLSGVCVEEPVKIPVDSGGMGDTD